MRQKKEDDNQRDKQNEIIEVDIIIRYILI